MNGDAQNFERVYTVTLTLPAGLDDAQAGCFLDCADDDALASSIVRDIRRGGIWTVQWITHNPPGKAEMTARTALAADLAGLGDDPDEDWDWTVEEVDQTTNWLEKSYEALPAFAVGDFYIYGSHHSDDVPAGKTGLLIDAATAFGSGEHGTTAGCLEALQALHADKFTPGSILDIGTGSGILALAAHKLWPAVPLCATDNDPEAVRVAAEHARVNHSEDDAIRFICAEGFDDPAVAAPGPYDLVIANILAGPLKDMAAQLCAATAPGGLIILSGILAAGQADEVQAVYAAQNATPARDRLVRGEWAILTLRKN